MAGVPYGMIIGGAMDTIGTAIMASGAEQRKKDALALANTPGIDFSALTGEALSGYQKNLGKATDVSGEVSAANQQQLLAREEAALPGIGAARQAALGRIKGLFEDDSQWLQGVQRRGAALGLSSGLGGSQAGQLQTLRLSDKESMGRTQLGTGLLGSLIGSMRIANTPGVQSFMGPSMSEQLATRSQERSTRLGMLSGANAMPSYWETWGQRLQQTGSALAGASSGSSPMGPPSSGSSFTTEDYAQQSRMASESGRGGGGGGGDSFYNDFAEAA